MSENYDYMYESPASALTVRIDPGPIDSIWGANCNVTPVFSQAMKEYSVKERERVKAVAYKMAEDELLPFMPPKPLSLWEILFGTKRKQRVRI